MQEESEESWIIFTLAPGAKNYKILVQKDILKYTEKQLKIQSLNPSQFKKITTEHQVINTFSICGHTGTTQGFWTF